MAEKKAPEKEAPEKKETEQITIPKSGRGDDSLFVCSNGRSYQIKKGETVEVPKDVAEIIRHSMMMKAKADAYIEEQQEKLKW